MFAFAPLLLALAFFQFTPSRIPGVPQVADRKMADDHTTEGWLADLQSTSSQSGDQLATTLVISRKRRELHRFRGEPYIWTWDFWQRGQQVVYQTGPAHGRTTCILADAESGRVIATQDWCNRDNADGPDWTRPVLK